MRKTTVKEVKKWFKTLEENRYKKTYASDARRVSWLVNNNLSEDYEAMPVSMRKKWSKAQYGRERFLAKEFVKHKRNEAKLRESIRRIVSGLMTEQKKDLMEAKWVQLKINKKDHDKARKLFKKLGLKDTKDFAFDALGLKGKMVGFQVKPDDYNKVLELFIKNNIKVRG